MKKIILLISIFLLSGCATNEINMKIDNSGNVYFSHKLNIEEDTELLQNFNVNTNKFQYNNDSNKYEITKDLGNIEDLSLNNGEIVNLEDYLNEDFEFKKLFDCNNLVFVNKCSAKFQIDLSDISKLNSIIQENDEEYNTSSDKYIIDTLNQNMTNKFTLNSELKVGKNNSNSFYNNTYTWNLVFGEINNIEFEIYKLNYDNILILILLIIVYVIINNIKSKSNQSINITNDDLIESLNSDKSISFKSETKKDNKKDIKNINDRIRRI